MSDNSIREEFESANGHRAWFVSGGRSDTGPEGYVYDEFVTDMCWTCWVGSRQSLMIKLPELLEALEAMTGLAIHGEQFACAEYGDKYDEPESITKAKSAIAKAKGLKP